MRLGFPANVLGFGVDATEQQTAQTCAAKGGRIAKAVRALVARARP
jgi:hypothetical protein